MNWKHHIAALALTAVALVATPTPSGSMAELAGGIVGKLLIVYLVVALIAGGSDDSDTDTDETAETGT